MGGCFLSCDLDFGSSVGNGSYALERFRVGMKLKLRALSAANAVLKRDHDLAATPLPFANYSNRYVIPGFA
jgi:hypothetical protein